MTTRTDAMGGRCGGALTLCAVIACAVLAASASAAAPARGAGAQASYQSDLTAFLKEMDASYPFFDAKGIRKGWAPFKVQLAKRVKACASDQEFLGIVSDTIAYLRDGHMGIVKARVELKPPEPEWYPGVSFMPASKGRVVVMAAAEPLAASLKPGTVVVEIDGMPARALLDKKSLEAWERGGPFSSPQRARMLEYRIPLRGKKGATHKLAVLDGGKRRMVEAGCVVQAQGWPHTYNMPAGLTRASESCLHGKLPSGVGYVYLRRIDPSVEPAIAAAIAAVPDAKGWIIDIRGNGGGGYGQELQQRLGTLKRPVAVITDAGCFSAGETFARDLVGATGARLVGSTTAGSSSAKRTWSFPSGIATLSLPTRSRTGIKGPIEFNGVRPDQELEAEPEEVAKGLNSEILRAEEYVLKAAGGK